MSRHAMEELVTLNRLCLTTRWRIGTQRQAGFLMNRYGLPRHEFATQPVIYEARVSARLRIEAALNKA